MRARELGLATACFALLAAVGPRSGAVAPASTVEWRLDNLGWAGGHALLREGEPRVVQTDIGPAVEFNGTSDGLFVDANPIAGLPRFTIEIVFRPAPGGPAEQRFLHLEEPGTGNRALIELRMAGDDTWALDTYLRSGDAGLTLLDRASAHPAGRWYVAALSYDGRTMAHFVDGRRELSGETTFAPLRGGRTSIGVRQNRMSWFKGQIHSLRVTPDALPADRLMRVPPGQPERVRAVLPIAAGNSRGRL